MSLSFDQDRPRQIRDYIRIQPGLVGPVGDVNVQPRLRNSANDLPIRFDPYFSHKASCSLGSGVQNGTSRSYMTNGIGPYTIDSNYTNRKRKVRNGWIMQDLRAPDTAHEPVTPGIPQISWNNKIATTYNAFRTGDKFLPSGPYAPHPAEVPRGGQVPRIVDDEAQELNSHIATLFGNITRPIVFGAPKQI